VSVLAVENARITLIAAGGFSEDHGAPAGADVEKWSGDRGIHLTEQVAENVGGAGLDQVKQTLLLLPLDIAAPELGDSVTYVFNGETLTRTVRQVEDHSAVGFIRLRFWDA
jgi:hypothetical protein